MISSPVPANPVPIEDRQWAQFERNGDDHAFGSQWAAFSRASVLPTLAADLDGGGKDPRTEEFVNRIEASMAARLVAAPQKMLIPLARMVLRKT